MNRKINNKIGFNDFWVMVIMIPITALIVPIVFFGIRFEHPPYFTINIFITTFVITSAIWIGNRFIMAWARNRYSLFQENKRRLIIQSLLIFAYTFVANNTLGFLLRGFCEINNASGSHYTLNDVLINSNSASVFCSLTIVAIYESQYFFNTLKLSIEEKEMLKRESLQAQLNALKTQVNPHFLFNNLNTLCSIIPENPNQAVSFVLQMAKVYRHILEVKDEKYIPLRSEMEILEAYSFLLKTRFGENLEINIHIDEQKMDDMIVPLSLQLLMENAIKHNIVSINKHLKIEVYVENDTLVFSNNLQKKNQIIESTGIGLNNIRNRYKLFTDRLIEIKETNFNFTVSIPLITDPLCA